jgi:hypothetical protein
LFQNLACAAGDAGSSGARTQGGRNSSAIAPTEDTAPRRSAAARRARGVLRQPLNLVSVALLAAALGATGAALAAESPGNGGAEKLVLRLPDVGRGYLIGDDSGCGGLGTENAPPSVAQVAITYYPVLSCSMEFERLWRARKRTPARGALFVSSTAFVFATDEGIRAGFGVQRDLLAYELGLESKDLTPRSERPALGDEASVFFVADSFALGRSGMPGLAIVWRQGRVLGVLYVVGLRERKAKQVALSLARRQTGRIAKPTPVPPRANDDRQVMLDNPRLGIRVYWFGLRFAPGRRLPSLPLASVDGPLRGAELGYRASLQYEGERDGVVLDQWKQRRWARVRRTKLGHGFWDKPCARKRIVQLRHGYAELFRSCAKRHARFVAHAYVAPLVVTVSPYCVRCDAGSGAYGSFKGLRTLVRGLRLRRR